MQKAGALVVSASQSRPLRSDQEFLPAALQILETPQSPVTSAFTLVICTLVVVAVAWSYFGKIDIVAVAPGKFAALGRTKVIEPLETGKVQAIGAVNGSEVKAPLSPGMSVSVEIQTGKRRILEYLFSPLVETASQALKER